ncbi:MAG: hypothetical protein WC827_01680 [Candidatus Paceibacterota bacterium]|jgi:hypothetical protein
MKSLKGFTDGIMLATFWLVISLEFAFIVMRPDDFITRKAGLILSLKTTSLTFVMITTCVVLCYLNFRKNNLNKITPEVLGFSIITASLIIFLGQNTLFQ